MMVKCVLVFLFVLNGGLSIFAAPAQQTTVKWKFVNRNDWGARPANGSATFNGPSPFIIIHHSYIPGAAFTKKDCIADMQYIQNLHMDTNGWDNIGYSFAICGDGNVYVGRGYNAVGAHTPLYNDRSIGLLLIGDYREQLPTPTMLAVAHEFIDYSVKCGYLRKDYILYGHRQVRNGTVCPGDDLYGEIQNWPHWQEVQSETMIAT